MRYLITTTVSLDTDSPIPAARCRKADWIAFHSALARAGVLLDGARLGPAAEGGWIHHPRKEGDRVRTTDAQSTRRLVGFALIQVRSHEDALEWVRRYPNRADGHTSVQIDVRAVPDNACDRLGAVIGAYGTAKDATAPCPE